MLTCIKQQSRPDYFHVAVNWMLSSRYTRVTCRKLSSNLTSQTNVQILFTYDYFEKCSFRGGGLRCNKISPLSYITHLGAALIF